MRRARTAPYRPPATATRTCLSSRPRRRSSQRRPSETGTTGSTTRWIIDDGAQRGARREGARVDGAGRERRPHHHAVRRGHRRAGHGGGRCATSSTIAASTRPAAAAGRQYCTRRSCVRHLRGPRRTPRAAAAVGDEAHVAGLRCRVMWVAARRGEEKRKSSTGRRRRGPRTSRDRTTEMRPRASMLPFAPPASADARAACPVHGPARAWVARRRTKREKTDTWITRYVMNLRMNI